MRAIPTSVIALLLAVCLISCATGPGPSSPLRSSRDLPKRLDDAGGAAYDHLLSRLPAAQTKSAEGISRGIPMDAYLRAQAEADVLPSYSTLARKFLSPAEKSKAAVPGWEFLGPINISGRMRSLVFDPRDANRMLVGGVSGGIWETLDGGLHWQALALNTANINIGSLLIDPQVPDTIYAGTGELYRNSERPFAAMWGQGILRSNDNGRSFQALLATLNDNFRYVSDLAVSPHDHRRIYAATNTGVWRSNDGGTSFVQVLRPIDTNAGLLYEGCSELQVLPDASRDVLLASCSSRSIDDRYYLPNTVVPPACNGPCPAAIYRNEDAASDSAAGWVQVLSEPGMGRTSIDYARSSPNVVYAVSASIAPGPDRTGDGVGDYDNGLHAVWRSNDGGLSWQAQVRNSSSDLLSTYLLSYADGFEAPRCGFGQARGYGAGWYNQAIAVDPVNPEVVWVAGMEHYRSDDGGRHFGKASYWYNFRVNSTGAHADQHLLRFHPDYDGVSNRRLYTLNDGGIGLTENPNAPISRGLQAACGPAPGDLVAWQDLSVGLGTAQFYTGTTVPDGNVYMGGMQDNSTGLGFGSPNWLSLYGGDGGGVAFDPSDPNTLYVSAQGITLARSEDGGLSFETATGGLIDQTIFIMPYVLDPQAPNRLFAGGTRVWRTDNQGRAWRTISTRLGTQYADRISAVAVAPTNSNHMMVGNQRAIFFNANALTANSSTQWTAVTPRSGWVSSLIYDPNDANIAYATYSSFGGAHVWRTSNGGAQWQSIDGVSGARLPDVPVHTLAIDPSDTQRLYVGTDIGIFVSLDGGQHWAQENSGFANVIVEALKVSSGGQDVPPRLFAFTYGRGAWRVPLADLTGTPDYRIGADTTGAFYNPAQSGHGWFIEAIPNNGVIEVLAAWYTYQDGEPRWLFGSGTSNGHTATITLHTGSNTDFPPRFDAAQVQVLPWGEVELDFDNADLFRARWSPNAQTLAAGGYSAGEMDFSRLSAPSPADNISPSSGISACHSGAWYNLEQPGHGFTIEVLGSGDSRELLATWYVHLNGHSYWLIGQGPIVGDTAVLEMLSLSGGQFPPNFNPDEVSRDAWGTLSFTAIDADHAHIAWSSQRPGFSSDELDLSRLTSTLGRACVE